MAKTIEQLKELAIAIQNETREGMNTAKRLGSLLNDILDAEVGTKTLEGGETFNQKENQATAICAHAEGSYTIASGPSSHAEGGDSYAGGAYSHAEGGSHGSQGGSAIGIGSHAEGSDTQANGNYSHAEGSGTITNNEGEHACGTFNVSNKGDTPDKKTQFSIGIGSQGFGKNAVEVMFNGDVYVIGIGGYDGTNTTADNVHPIQEHSKNTIFIKETNDIVI